MREPAVTSLVQRCLEPEFRRGHGAFSGDLAAGRIDDERLLCLLTETLTPLVDEPEARAWIAGHDITDRPMLDRALSGLPPGQGAQVRDACARWSRVRVVVDRPPISGRGRNAPLPGPGAHSQRGLPLQGLHQDRPGLGVPARRRHRPPAHGVGGGHRRPEEYPGHNHLPASHDDYE